VKLEKWIVMVVKDPWLRDTLIDDIEFQKSSAQLLAEKTEKNTRQDEETPRKCPKCLRNYVPKEARDGNCYYHPGFVVDINDPTKHITGEEAQEVLQCAILYKLPEEKMPKLVWACCLRMFTDSSHPCEVGKCGLPKEMEGKIDMSQGNYVAVVQEKNKENAVAKKKLEEFLQRYTQTKTNKSSADSTKKPTASSTASEFHYK
jgi:hypothetical protein